MLFYNVVILFLVIAGVDYASKKHVAAKRGLSVNPKRLMKHLGILTPYKFNANYNLMLGNEHSGCATKIWMIVGYGTSYPTEKHINKMSDELFQVRQQIIGGFAQKKSKLSFKTIGEFDRWKPLIEDTGDALKLSAQGQKEMFNLAKRMQKRFPEIFPKKFSNKTYLFRYASDGRIKNCANYFAQGLFENKNEVRRVFFPRPNEKDMPIIRAHTACQKYKDDVSESDAAWADIEKFYDSQDMQYAIQKTNQFLGTDLTNDEVELMYITCAYESGWMKSISTWCNAFDLETIKPFEYVDDLTQYWYHGYGYKVTSKLACMAVRDAVLFFNDRRNKRSANIYFTDTSSVLHILVNLGLYKGKRLTNGTYKRRNKSHWKASRIAGFGNNLAFIYYSCSKAQYISVLHNERFVKLQACANAKMCDFSQFKEYYNANINKCNFDRICENDN